MRARWSAPIRKYWKISEQMMVKYCDLAICDSVNIEKYIHECYDGKGIKGRNPKTTFIAYVVHLAEGIGVSRQTMSKIMNGARAINAIELHKISEYLHVSMDSLMKMHSLLTILYRISIARQESGIKRFPMI